MDTHVYGTETNNATTLAATEQTNKQSACIFGRHVNM